MCYILYRGLLLTSLEIFYTKAWEYDGLHEEFWEEQNQNIRVVPPDCLHERRWCLVLLNVKSIYTSYNKIV